MGDAVREAQGEGVRCTEREPRAPPPVAVAGKELVGVADADSAVESVALPEGDAVAEVERPEITGTVLRREVKPSLLKEQ